MFVRMNRAAWLAILALTSLASACATYPTMEERSAMLARNIEFFAPPGNGPAPLVILMSGCGGMVGESGPNPIMKKYAAAATQSGAYAVIVDSFQPRGIDYKSAVTTVCTAMQLRGDSRAGDILAAEALAEKHWDTRFTGIILSGWSHGAWSIMELLLAGPAAKKVGNLKVTGANRALTPDAVTLYYPYCGFLNGTGRKDWAFGGPIQLVTAELDSIGIPKECQQILESARPDMKGVDAFTFPGMTHAFDEESQGEGSAFRYDVENSAKLEAMFSKFVSEQTARLR